MIQGYLKTLVRTRLSRNQNFLCAVIGPTGSGKSYYALAMGESLDPSFSVGNLAFTPDDFVQLVRDGEKGSVIIFDDAGLGMPSRKWYDMNNQLLSYVLQSCRSHNQIICFTMPSMSFIDVAARRLFHCVFSMVSYGKAKIYMLRSDAYEGNIYREFPHTLQDSGLGYERSVTVEHILIPKPSDALIGPYEEKKTEYLDTLYSSLHGMLEPQQKSGSRDAVVLAMRAKGMSLREIANILDVHHSTIDNILKKDRKLHTKL